jgi:hypothetical protein
MLTSYPYKRTETLIQVRETKLTQCAMDELHRTPNRCQVTHEQRGSCLIQTRPGTTDRLKTLIYGAGRQDRPTTVSNLAPPFCFQKKHLSLSLIIQKFCGGPEFVDQVFRYYRIIVQVRETLATLDGILRKKMLVPEIM